RTLTPTLFPYTTLFRSKANLSGTFIAVVGTNTDYSFWTNLDDSGPWELPDGTPVAGSRLIDGYVWPGRWFLEQGHLHHPISKTEDRKSTRLNSSHSQTS